MALEFVLIVVAITLLFLLIWGRAPFFQAIFERRDRDTLADNKIVSPSHGEGAEKVKEAEEQGRIDRDGIVGE